MSILKAKLLIGILVLALFSGAYLGCGSAKRETKESTKKEKEETGKKESAEKEKDKEDIRFGLNLEERKEIVEEINKIQNEVPPEDPQYNEKMQEAYSTVAKKYDLSEDTVRQIAIEGAQKNWLAPPEP